jgi:hypothetical protein
VEEEETWRTKTPSKKENEQEKRLATIEKKALVGSLTTALSKQKNQCNQVIAKAGKALDLSNKAMETLALHISTLDEEIGNFELIANSNTDARKDLEAQVNKISEYITSNLVNIPKGQLAELKALIAQTAHGRKSVSTAWTTAKMRWR